MKTRESSKPVTMADDEIELKVIFNSFLNIFKSLGHSIVSFFDLIKKYWIVLLVSTLLGALGGYIAYKFSKTFYTSSMTLVLAEIRNEFVENQLDRLSIMIEEDNYEAVASDLDISIESAMQIKEMTFSNLDQDRIAEDSVLTGSPFKIQISLYDNGLFQTMGPALASYLESNQFFSKQKNIRQREIEGMIAKLKSEIASIDSIKTSVSSPKGPVSGFVYGEPIDPTNLFRESVSMYQQQSELEAELDQLDNIQIVNSFTPRLRPTGPKLLLYLIVGVGIAFLVGLIVAIYLEINKRKQVLL